MSGLVVGVLPKNARQRIVVRLDEDGGRRRADVRVAMVNRKNKLRSTVAGFQLERASLPVLIGLLQRAHAQACAGGWCANE